MKKIRGILAGILVLAAAGFGSISHAQLLARSVSAELVDDSPVEPKLVEPAMVPVAGTFFMLSDFQQDVAAPPYPCNPFPDAAVYSTSAEGIYVVDDSAVRKSAFAGTADVQATTEVVLERIQTLVQSVRAAPMESEMSLATGAFESSAMNKSGGAAAAFSYPEGSLWLQIEAMTDSAVPVILNGVQDGRVYQLMCATNLNSAIAWSSEQSLHSISNQNWIATTVAMGSRTDALFLWAMDWTDSDVNSNSIPDWYEFENFSRVLEPGNFDFDQDGYDDLSEYQNGTDPNTIAFWITATNQYSSTSLVPLQLDVTKGVPSSMAVLVDNTNLASANWIGFSSNITVNLGATEGWHTVRIGLRGRLGTSQQTWETMDFKLDTTPPVLAITSPSEPTTARPIIQVKGFGSEPLGGIYFDVVNASGALTNEQGSVTDQTFNTNTFEYTTNYFQLYDVGLADGTNSITVRVADLAGNVTTTHFEITLDVMSNTNPPVVSLIWPQDGMQLSGTSFTLRGRLDDDTAHVTAEVVDPNGTTNVVEGSVERGGIFWMENLPLTNGNTAITLIATNAAGLCGTNSLTVSKSSVDLTLTYYGDGQAAVTTVTGTIGDTNYVVSVNGTEATVDEYGNWTAFPVHVYGRGMASLTVVAVPNGTANRSSGSAGLLAGGRTAMAASSSSGGGSGGGSTISTAVEWEMPSFVALTENHGRLRSVWTSSNPDGAVYASKDTKVDYVQQWKQAASGEWYRTYTAKQVDVDFNDYWQTQIITTYDWSDSDPVGTYVADGINEGEPYHDSGTMDNLIDEARKRLPWEFGGSDTGVVKHSQAMGATYHWESWEPNFERRETADYELTVSTRGEYVVPGKSAMGSKVLLVLTGTATEYGTGNGSGGSSSWDYVPSRVLAANATRIGGKQPDEERKTYQAVARGEVVDATLTSAAKHSGNRVTPSHSELRIFWNGEDITSKTKTAIVGQQIALSCALAGDEAPPITNFIWTVPGYAISNFYISADTRTGMVVEPFPKTNSWVAFHWVDGGSKEVGCKVTIKGEEMQTKTTFGITRPTIDFSGEITGTVAMDQDYAGFTNLLVHFGGVMSNGVFTPGIKFRASNPNLIGWSDGSYAFSCVQVITSNQREGTKLDGTITNNTSRTGLDNIYPYASLGSGEDTETQDSPAKGVASDERSVSLSTSFRMVLLFQTDLPGIAVPLREINWNWNAYAYTNGTGGWSHDTNSTARITANNIDTTRFPNWTNLVLNITSQ